MGIWTQVEVGDTSLIQLCSNMLQSSRPQYNGSLTFNNLSILLAQTNRDDDSDMFEMYLYQDDASSAYDLVLVEYLSLKRDGNGNATRHHWCLTFGVSPTTTKTASQLYAILKAEVKQQMTDEPDRKFWYVYLEGDSFYSGSLFDQIVQLLFSDGNVQKSGDKPEPTYAAYLNDFGNNTLHRFHLQKIN